MGPTHGPYILQLCIGPSYFSGVWPLPLISHPGLFCCFIAFECVYVSEMGFAVIYTHIFRIFTVTNTLYVD